MVRIFVLLPVVQKNDPTCEFYPIVLLSSNTGGALNSCQRINILNEKKKKRERGHVRE